MKKMSVFTLLILTFVFSAQLSFAMDCFGWLKKDQYTAIPQKERKIVTPIEAHYNAIMEIMPKIQKLATYGEMADAITIVKNAKTKFAINERDLGLFAFKQNHPEKINKGASLLIALIEQYNKEIEEKKMPILTRTELEINGQVYGARTDPYMDDHFLLKSIGLENKTNTQPEVNSATKLAISIGLLTERFNQWDGMATALYGNKKDSNESTTPDEDSLH